MEVLKVSSLFWNLQKKRGGTASQKRLLPQMRQHSLGPTSSHLNGSTQIKNSGASLETPAMSQRGSQQGDSVEILDCDPIMMRLVWAHDLVIPTVGVRTGSGQVEAKHVRAPTDAHTTPQYADSDNIIILSRILKLRSQIAHGIEFLISECINGYAFSITCLGRL